MSTDRKRPLIILAIVLGILLIPLVAMQFSEEVKWTLSDFIVAGALLLTAGFCLDLILRKVGTRKNRILLAVLLLLVVLLVWAELAVGIFGTAFAGS